MKKNLKRVAVGLLSIALLLSGCGQKNEQNATENGSDKSLTYWCAMPSGIVSVYRTMGEVSMYRELEKRTGVHIDFIHPPTGQEGEKFNLMIASKDLPDMVEYSWISYVGGPEKAINDNVIIKLNDYLEKSAPNFTRAIRENKEYEKQTKTDSGSIYGFPALNMGKYRIFGGIVIRQDWLDELNLSMPQTIDEWETVLRAFKEQKGADAPFTGDATLFSIGGYNNTFNNAFNVGKGFYVENGVVKFGPAEPAYKDWIMLMNRWYEEGLLDRNYETNNSAALDSKITNGDAGAMFTYIGSGMGRYLQMQKEKNPSYNLTAAPYPVAVKGEQPILTPLAHEASYPFLAITTACKTPQLAVEWADYLYSDEGMMLCNYGVEGESYNMVDGKPVYTEQILKNPEGLSIAEMLQRYCRATNSAPGFNEAEDYIRQYYPFQQQKDALELWTQATENVKAHTLPPVTFTIEESDRIASINAEILTYVSENVLKFVQGTRNINEFEDFIDELKSIKLDEYIQIYQNAYDRYLKR